MPGSYSGAPIDYSTLPAVTPSYGMTTLSGQLGGNSGNQATQQQGANTGQSRAYFSPEQLAAQQNVLGNLSGYLSGQQSIPAYMTAPPEVFQAYNSAFDKYVKPGIAAQYGAGSPQIGGQQSYGNMQLAAQLYQGGLQNYLGAMGMYGNLAFNPQGQNTQAANAAQGQQQFDQNNWNLGASTTNYGPSLLSLLLSRI